MTERRRTTNAQAQAAVPPLVAEDHVCPTCGVVYSETSIERADEVIGELPASFRAVVAAIPPGAYRRRPEAGTWSVVEYLCHVRDVYATYTIRLHRARTEHEPVLEPMLNDLRARRFDYLHRDVQAVLDELEANAAGLRAEIARTPSGSWERRVSRLPGERRTALWLVRQAMHEGVHHLSDITRVGEQITSSLRERGRLTGAGAAARLRLIEASRARRGPVAPVSVVVAAVAVTGSGWLLAFDVAVRLAPFHG